MEELHRIHKDAPFGYWVEWVQPGLKFLAGKWRAFLAAKPSRDHLLTLR